MRAIDTALFDGINAIPDPQGLFLWFALHGASLMAVLVAWVFLRYPQQRWHALVVVLSAALASYLAHALADGLDFPRPYMLGKGAPDIPHGVRGALPSAHATVMFSVALLLWQRRPLRVLAGLALVLALLTSWSRIHVGVHFPSDIAAGLVLAMLIATAVHLLTNRLRRPLAAWQAAAKSAVAAVFKRSRRTD